ncbi:heterodisulfide reductase-related iron-sulfur binding cluster [Paradesulfitobacterium aromaticivorans]
MNDLTRQFMPFMPPNTKVYMYLIFLIAVVVMLIGWYKKIKLYLPKPGDFFKQLIESFKLSRIKEVVWTQVLKQRKITQDSYAGLMHVMLFWGMSILVLGTILVAVDEYLVLIFKRFHILSGGLYISTEFVLDLAGLALIIGIILALFRRLYLKTPYLSVGAQPYLILIFLGFIGLSGFTLEGARLFLQTGAGGSISAAGSSSFVGLLPALMFSSLSESGLFSREVILSAYPILWWSHTLAAMSFIALLPYTNFAHLILVPLNLAVKENSYPQAKLSTPFKLIELAEQEEETEITIGISKADDLDWKQRLETDSCVNCGRCAKACPAVAAGRELSPQQLIQGIKNQLSGQGDQPLPVLNAESDPNTVWSCTNCASCTYECPSAINHVDFVLNFRRHLLSNNQVDAKKTQLLTALDNNGNPYGLASYKRSEWLEDYEVPLAAETDDFEYLYWMGCLAAYDQRASNIGRSMIKLFKHVGVNIAVLGTEEKCCGETAKRLGEEGRFQMIAQENIELMQSYGVKKIITHCPHCYNTLKHEYPEFGGDFEVMHHSQFLAHMVQLHQVELDMNNEKIVFHDPCNLSRLNNIREEPRYLLKHTTTDLLEVKKSGTQTFCCGAGGGNNWYSVPESTKISHLRLDQLLEADPDKLVVACPFCLGMFEDALKVKGVNKTVCDIGELIADSISISERSTA